MPTPLSERATQPGLLTPRNHVEASLNELPERLIRRATGRYYTHPQIAEHFIPRLLLAQHAMQNKATIKVCDPFAGDGRLVVWLIQHWQAAGLPNSKWEIDLWDLDSEGLEKASHSLARLSEDTSTQIAVHAFGGDAFKAALQYEGAFDLVVTNPPWEVLKPDARELGELPVHVKQAYVASMRAYASYLRTAFPDSQARTRFAGWGTNLSRVGLEVARFICRPGGVVGIVMPASFFADDQSSRLRGRILATDDIRDIAYFPAEARLFKGADLPTSTLVFRKDTQAAGQCILTAYDAKLRVTAKGTIHLNRESPAGESVPISLGPQAVHLLGRLRLDLPTWSDLEERGQLWAGREIDETRSAEWLLSSGTGPLFIRGRMIDRFTVRESPSLRINRRGWRAPVSSRYERIAWRDISRPSQKRRMIATLIPDGTVAGNSLGVAYFRDSNRGALIGLLGIMNSACFEIQLRSHLATGHISLTSLRKVAVPDRSAFQRLEPLRAAVIGALAGNHDAFLELEAVVARLIYKLTEPELVAVLELFAKVERTEKDKIVGYFRMLSSESGLS